jgi:diphthamide synthase (EF-2-diphthine--ammonia ligase)
MIAAPDLAAYRRFIVAFSGGKDSLAALLHLFASGVPADRIELHHHEVDKCGPSFMNWPCVVGYVRAIAAHLGVTLYLSWRDSGVARELDRVEATTAPVLFEHPAGIGSAGGRGLRGTRGVFPRLPRSSCPPV